MKLTSWFPGDVKPVRVGVYERDYQSSRPSTYCYWNGTDWSAWRSTPKKAFSARFTRALWQNLPWRGVLK